MKLVNKNYVKMDEFDIFHQMVKAGATEKSGDIEKISFFQNLFSVLSEYKKEHHLFDVEFYLNVKDIDINSCEITRELIINALVYASITKDFKMVEQITPYLYAKRYTYSDNNEILNYILEHGMSPNEFIDGESKKLIFNSETNSLEYGYIHNHSIKLERRKK